MKAILSRLLAAFAVAGAGMALGDTAPQTFSNPVLNEDFPDPNLLRVGKTYYAYSTNADGENIPTFESPDLVHWTTLGEALPILPEWATGGFTWAPDLMAVKSGYVMYFTARHTDSGRQCIGVAFSATPEGPFVSSSNTPLVCQLDKGGSIDPNSFTDKDGRHYLYWKNDGNCCNQPTGLWVQPLSADGLTLTGEPKDLIDNGQLWEGNLIEAPFMYLHAGKYYLFYSAAAWNTTTYAVGYAVGSSPLGPFQKSEANPILTSSGDVAGPGGEGIITDGKNQDWMYYHAWSSSAIGYPAGGQRALMLSPLQWKGAVPSVQTTTQSQPAPAAP